MPRAKASSSRRPKVNTGRRAAANELPAKATAEASSASTLGFLPSDPVDHRLTVDGVILGPDGKVNAEAYADLVPHFAGEPAPAEHPYPDAPGLRLNETQPKGLRLWDDIKSGIEKKDGAGWIAVHNSKRFGKKEKWFNIRTCGSWRLAFLLARLQREVWDRHGLVAGPESEDVEETAKDTPKENGVAARFEPKPAPSLKAMVAASRMAAFPGVLGEIGGVHDVEATPKRKRAPSAREGVDKASMPSAKKRKLKPATKPPSVAQPMKQIPRPRGAPPPVEVKPQIFDRPLPQGIEDVLLKQQQEATRARKEQLLARLQAKFQKNTVEDVLSKEWDLMAQEQKSNGLFPTAVGSGDAARRRLRKKTAPQLHR